MDIDRRMAEELKLQIHGDASLPTLIYFPGLHGDWTLNGRFRKQVLGRVRLVELTYRARWNGRWTIMPRILSSHWPKMKSIRAGCSANRLVRKSYGAWPVVENFRRKASSWPADLSGIRCFGWFGWQKKPSATCPSRCWFGECMPSRNMPALVVPVHRKCSLTTGNSPRAGPAWIVARQLIVCI